MKKLFFILSFLFPVSLLAGNRYFFNAVTGSDGGGGTQVSPWATNVKFNSLTLAGDDTVFFNGRFPGKFYLLNSGTAGHQIVITTYGTGGAILEGFEDLSGHFTTVSGSIMQATCNTCQGNVNMVRWYGINTPVARTPNYNSTDGGFWKMKTGTTQTLILSDSIPSGTAFVGAKLVVHRDNFSFDPDSIIAQTTGQFTIAAYEPTPPLVNFGIFVQGTPVCIDQSGEWAWVNSSRKLQMQVDSTPTAQYAVEASAIDTVLTVNASYITIRNITIEGANKYNIAFTGNCSHDSLINVNVQFAGVNGIEVSAPNSSILSYFGLMYSNIRRANNNGFSVIYPAQVNDSRLLHDSIDYNAMIPGAGLAGGATYGGVQWYGNRDTMIDCSFSNNGGPGWAQYGGDTSYWYHCIFKNDGQVTADVGGMYISVHSGVRNTLRSCVAANCLGNNFGTDQPFPIYGVGFYEDNKCTNLLLDSCTAYGNSYNGLMLHMARYAQVSNFTAYNNTLSQFYFQESTDTGVANTITHSYFVSKRGKAVVTWYIGNFGNLNRYFTGNDYNVYARPTQDDTTFRSNAGGKTLYTLAQWKGLIGQDANSTGSPLKTSNDASNLFYVNESLSDTTVQIPQAYVNLLGVRQTAGPRVLHPFESLLLLPQPKLSVAFRRK